MRIKIKHHILTAVICSFICSCAWNSYNKPEVEAPKNWYSKDQFAKIESADMSETPWWNSLQDKNLDQLVESALLHNNNIQIAIGNITAAKGQLQQVQSAWIPIVNASAGYQQKAVYAEGYNAGIMPSYTINLMQLIKQYQSSKANVLAQQNAKNAVRLTVISQVVGAYISLTTQNELLDLQNKLVSHLAEMLKIAKIQESGGLISLYQVQQYEQQLLTAKSKLPTVASNVQSSMNALSVLINQNIGKIENSSLLINSSRYIPVLLPSEVLHFRPDIIQAEQGLIAANANIGVATSQFFPSISLTGNAGASSAELSNLFTPDNEFWVRTAAISMPILNFGIFGQINTAKGQYYSAYYNYLETVRNAFASVDTDLAAHDAATKSLLEQLQYMNSTSLALRIAEHSYQSGLFDKLTYLTNCVTEDNAEIAAVQSKQLQLNSIVQLYQDLGSGYNYKNYDSATKIL